MSSGVLFQQLLVLLAFMCTGMICYKTNIIDDHTYKHLSSLMVWILNPFLMISGVLGKNTGISQGLVMQNILMVLLCYGSMFAIGFLFIFIAGIKGKRSYMYRLVMLFPNVGFMGIPLVKAIFGNEYIVYVAFYMLAFNVICYTYGIHLSARLGGREEKLQLKKLITPGTVTALLSIGIFALHIQVPDPVKSYCDYLGNATIPFSMLIIGVSLAKQNWKLAFAKKDYYIFAAARMLLVPIILVFISRQIPIDPVVVGVFQIEICMPVASMTCMIAQEYGGDGSEPASLIALTTILTVITAPLVILIAG